MFVYDTPGVAPGVLYKIRENSGKPLTFSAFVVEYQRYVKAMRKPIGW